MDFFFLGGGNIRRGVCRPYHLQGLYKESERVIYYSLAFLRGGLKRRVATVLSPAHGM